MSVTQTGLVGRILKALGAMDKSLALNPRQMNAVIKAADIILAELGKPDVPTTPAMGLVKWLQSDDAGISSMYMAYHLARACGSSIYVRVPDSSEPYPHDPNDFGRCMRLLEAEPILRDYISELREPSHGPEWNAIAAEWEILEAWYCEDATTGKSKRLYSRLCAIRDAARKAK